jgi:hypothetical protein
MLRGRDPQSRLPVVERLVLAREIETFALSASSISATLREGSRALGELGGYGSVLFHPVSQSIFAVLDDTVWKS